MRWTRLTVAATLVMHLAVLPATATGAARSAVSQPAGMHPQTVTDLWGAKTRRDRPDLRIKQLQVRTR